MSDSFKLYGSSFQIKVLAALITDRDFLQQISDILNPNYFDSDGGEWVAQKILEYFSKYKTSPTLDAFKLFLQEEKSDLLKTAVHETLSQVMTSLESVDLTFVKDQTLNFCKNQTLKQAILKSVDLLKRSDYDGIKSAIDYAMRAGTDADIGHVYTEHLEDRFMESIRDVKPMPWKPLNDLTQGGLGKGELGIFVAPAGIGKSTALLNVAAHTARMGKTAFYYSLELSQTYVGARFDSHFSGIPPTELKTRRSEVEEALSKIKGEVVIKYYPTKSATVNTIASHLEKSILQGYTPDVIIVDYADLLKDSSGRSAGRHDQVLGNIYEDLRGLAGTFNIPIYTASQANRSATEQEIIEADKIAESYSKIMIADLVVSLSRKVEDKLSGTGRWHVIKNRFGADGITFPSKMDMAISKIDIFEPTSEEGAAAKRSMQGGNDAVRTALAAKFRELSS